MMGLLYGVYSLCVIGLPGASTTALAYYHNIVCEFINMKAIILFF